MSSPILAVCASGEVSGAELVLLRLVERAVAEGRDVTVASPDGPLVDRIPAGVAHVGLPPAGRQNASSRLRRLSLTSKWLVSWISAARTIRAESRRPGTHVVVNALLALPPLRLARPRGGAVWLVHDVIVTDRQRWFVRFARPSLRRTVAVSDAAAAPLRELGLDVDVRPNGVAWPVAPRRTDPDRPLVVGSVGLVAPWKGTHVLLDAVAALPDVRLQIAGGHFGHDASYVDELRVRAGRPDLDGRVTFLGHTEDALETMRSWDVFVSSSVRPEAGPMTVIEAMSVGLPVVATDHGGPQEYLAEDRGELVPPNDAPAMAAAIRRLADDPARRHDLGERGREYVADRFDRSVTFPAQYEAVMT
ncbi:glycosyltransferase family 4 protein [Desertimonas flava]|uniref:glycosyltransferase family 4 protein n=1 Tax=Desertimonas flava TaxID=2064846 RepID=UPI000E347A06|nr:glycosyltransferase family 4 protein [Desertimonas flava]